MLKTVDLDKGVETPVELQLDLFHPPEERVELEKRIKSGELTVNADARPAESPEEEEVKPAAPQTDQREGLDRTVLVVESRLDVQEVLKKRLKEGDGGAPRSTQ